MSLSSINGPSSALACTAVLLTKPVWIRRTGGGAGGAILPSAWLRTGRLRGGGSPDSVIISTGDTVPAKNINTFGYAHMWRREGDPWFNVYSDRCNKGHVYEFIERLPNRYHQAKCEIRKKTNCNHGASSAHCAECIKWSCD